MSDSTNNGPSREGSAERVLREGLKANVLSPEALQRIRQATEQEWRVVTRAPARRGWRTLAAAASIAVLAVGIGWAYFATYSGSANGAILGEVASFDAPGMIEARPLRRDVVLVAGSKLRVGQVLDVRGDSLVSLGWRRQFAHRARHRHRGASPKTPSASSEASCTSTFLPDRMPAVRSVW